MNALHCGMNQWSEIQILPLFRQLLRALIYFKQTLIKEEESQKEAQRVLKDSSKNQEDHLRKTGSSRLPVEYSLVFFLDIS
ncbi:MAG: hypothetical protein U5O69_02305 [Candidatus Competibacteraceae bacterium]|nr:hypothetical protein [Candidatus Competibacteraceae bacterium]